MELRVDISRIVPGEPLTLDLNGTVRLPDGLNHSVSLTGTLTRESGVYTAGRYLTEGRFTAEIRTVCALCLAEAMHSINGAFNEIFSREKDEKVFSEDWQFTDNIIDLSQAVAANIIAALPMRITCSEDCKGLCPVCGIDRNNSECTCSIQFGGFNNGSDLPER